jgi:DNA-binding NtrC family response regulator
MTFADGGRTVGGATCSAGRGDSDHSIATILLVEDDERFRFAAQAGLETAGYRVLSSGSVKTALSILTNDEPDLLLTDLRLRKNIDGLVLSSMARVERPTLRVLFMTDAEELLSIASDYGTVLAKPMELDVLVAAVRRELAKSR